MKKFPVCKFKKTSKNIIYKVSEKRTQKITTKKPRASSIKAK